MWVPVRFEVVAQDLHQQGAGLDGDRAVGAVDSEGDRGVA